MTGTNTVWPLLNTTSTPGRTGPPSPQRGVLSQWGAEQPRTETEFRDAAVQEGDDWPWWRVVGGADRMETTLVELRQELAKLVRFG